MSAPKEWSWIVTHSAAHERADRAILSAYESGAGTLKPEESPRPALSRSQLQRLIEEARVTSQGAPIKSNAKLAAGTEVRVVFPPPRRMELAPEDRPLEILYQDEHLVVINKPPGLTVHPSETQTEGTLVHALLFHVRDLSGIGGVLRPGIVHRLDKDTSGALVVSKTDAAHRRLTEIFSKHEIERRYWAFCYGSPKGLTDKERRIESLIGRNPGDRKKMSMEVGQGRRAITYLARLRDFAVARDEAPFASWIEARLETGRTHQVRVHLTGIGHSVIGDPVYGVPSERHPKWLALPEEVREAARALPGQALHARVLGFTHPITAEKLRFEAEPPPAFRKLFEALARYGILGCRGKDP